MLTEIPWLALTVISLAAFTQGFLGFGFGILAMGILSATRDLYYATALVNLAGLVLCLVILWPLRRKILWQRIAPVLLLLVPGLFLGVQALVSMDPAWLRRILGFTIISFAAWSLLERSKLRQLSRWWSIPAGLGSGALSGAFNMGGPPVIAYFFRQPFTAEEIKASLQAIFLVTGLFRIPLVGAKGMLTGQVLTHSLLCAPGIVIAALLGIFLCRRVSPEKFRTAVWVVFGVMGLYLILQS